MTVRSVGPKPQSRRQLSHGAAGGDDVRVRRDGDPQAVLALLTSFEEGLAEARAGLALEDVLRGPDFALPALVAAAQGDEHRAAPVGRRLHPLEGQDVLDAQPRPGAVEPRGDGAGRAALTCRQGAGVGATDLVIEQRASLPVGQASERGGHGGLFLVQHDLGVRGVGRAEVDHSMLVAPLAVVVSPHRGDDVAGRHDRIGLEHARLDRRGGGEHPCERLLDEVVRGGMGADAGVDDAPHHRYQRRHLGAAVGPRRVGSDGATSSLSPLLRFRSRLCRTTTRASSDVRARHAGARRASSLREGPEGPAEEKTT